LRRWARGFGIARPCPSRHRRTSNRRAFTAFEWRGCRSRSNDCCPPVRAAVPCAQQSIEGSRSPARNRAVDGSTPELPLPTDCSSPDKPQRSRRASESIARRFRSAGSTLAKTARRDVLSRARRAQRRAIARVPDFFSNTDMPCAVRPNDTLDEVQRCPLTPSIREESDIRCTSST